MQKGLDSFVKFVSSHVNVEQSEEKRASEELKIRAQYTSGTKMTSIAPVSQGMYKKESDFSPIADEPNQTNLLQVKEGSLAGK